MHTSHSLQKHRQKNHVHADKGRPEMHFAPELTHLPASRFREPVIDAREESEDCARRHDVMKVRDHVIRIVQIKIGRIKCQRDAGKTANSKPWKKRDGKELRDVEETGAARKSNEKRGQAHT